MAKYKATFEGRLPAAMLSYRLARQARRSTIRGAEGLPGLLSRARYAVRKWCTGFAYFG